MFYLQNMKAEATLKSQMESKNVSHEYFHVGKQAVIRNIQASNQAVYSANALQLVRSKDRIRLQSGNEISNGWIGSINIGRNKVKLTTTKSLYYHIAS